MSLKKVILAGAGPGDPELISIKAVKYLQLADIVIADRLVSESILHRYTHPAATILFVGKEGFNHASSSQEYINELLVAHYYSGKQVVRLKGGDVAFYSNILDELQVLEKHQIPFKIIPGITAASGASAYAGIPLTARGYADSVRFLTYYHKKTYPDTYWKELAETEDTLVYYMSGLHFKHAAEQLARFNIHGKSIAVIEQATTPYQRVLIHRFDNLETLETTFISPTLIIVGKVVDLHTPFAWLPDRQLRQPYFRSLSKHADTAPVH